MFNSRRGPDAVQKKQMNDSSATIAEILVQHLQRKAFSESFPVSYV
jgi:hypothetical protein